MKKFLAILLSCALLVSCVPVIALADTPEPPPEESKVITEAVDAYITNLVGTIKEYAQKYANDPKVTEVIDFVNNGIDKWQQEVSDAVVEIENAQDTFDRVKTLVAEGRFDEIPAVLDKIPFDKIEEYISELDDYIHEATAAADQARKFIIDSKIDDLIRDLVTQVQTIRDDLADLVKDFTDDQGNFSITVAIEMIQDYVTDHLDEFKETGDKVKKAIDQTAEFLKANYPQAYAAIEEKINEIQGYIDEAIEANPEAAAKIKEAVQKIKDYLATNPDLAADFQDLVEEIIEKAEAFADQAIAEAIRLIDLKGAGEKVKQAFDQAVESLKENYAQEYAAVAEKFDEIRDYIDGVIEANPEAIEQIQNLIKQIKDYLATNPDISKDFQDLVKEIIGQVEAYAKEAIAEAVKLADLDALGEQVKQALDQAVGFLKENYAQAYAVVAEKFDEIRDYIDGVIEANPEAVEQIQDLVQKIKDYLATNPDISQDFQDFVKEIIEKVEAYVDGVKAQIAENIKNYIAKIYEKIDAYKTEIEEKIAEITATKEAIEEFVSQIKEDLIAAAEAGTLAATLDGYIEEINLLLVIAEMYGYDTTIMQKLTEKAADLVGIVAAIEAVMPIADIKTLGDLTAVAKALLASYSDQILQKVIEMYQAGDFDQIMEVLGLTPQEIIQKIVEIYMMVADAQAYIEGVRDGKGYLDLEFENDILKMNIESLNSDITSLYEDLNYLGQQLGLAEEGQYVAQQQLKKAESDLAKAKKSSSSNEKMVKQLKNAIKVMKGKPKIKKAKTAKGKKITIAWKGIKKATVTKYIVKIGKKSVKVSGKTKKLTQKNKAVKKILKKIKKGKKVKITVTALYKIGKTSYKSKVSKAKTVKIK